MGWFRGVISSAPKPRTNASFRPEADATTRSPIDFAIWIVYIPTEVDPPFTKIVFGVVPSLCPRCAPFGNVERQTRPDAGPEEQSDPL